MVTGKDVKYNITQCWDLPNYILKRYWGFITWGNANAMAQKSNYRGYDFKIYRNTRDFIPKPGDFAVWANSNPGHVAIVLGPSTKSFFYSADQNWYTANSTGSACYRIKHPYDGGPGGMVTHFVRPPYKAESATSAKPNTPTKDDEEKAPTKKEWKDVKEITVSATEFKPKYPEFIYHFIAMGNVRTKKPKGMTVRNAHTMSSVSDMYIDRKKYKKEREYPHFYIDRNHIWAPRRIEYEVPSDPDNIVLEVCEDLSASKADFILNEIHAMIFGISQMDMFKIEIKRSNLNVDPKIWRTMWEHVNWDMVVKGMPKKEIYDKLEVALLNLYKQREDLLTELTKENNENSKIRVEVKNKNRDNVNSSTSRDDSTSSSSHTSGSTTPKVTVAYSNYTFNRAVNIQVNVNPQINYGNGWYRASYSQTLNAMNSLDIWNSGVQKYQMLNLGKYQGVPVSKLNQILRGKGTLSGQGEAFAYACKKYQLNEIYLIAHAFLESGYGRSNYASGRYGIYNYFGIGAYDWNPNYSITLARNRGWTTPAKGIIGGAKFVRQDFIDKGQQTLYRMRWNPQHPGTHQYATDVRWAQHQATTIYNLYHDIGLRGLYFLRDKYKQ